MSPLPSNDNSDTLLSLAMYIVEFKASSTQLPDIRDKFDYTNTCTSILVYINRKGIGKMTNYYTQPYCLNCYDDNGILKRFQEII